MDSAPQRLNRTVNQSADDYFVKRAMPSPMTLFFINLPHEDLGSVAECRMNVKKANMVIRSGNRQLPDGSTQFLGLPYGMKARRILLSVFTQMHQAAMADQPLIWIPIGKSSSGFLRQLGYESASSFSSSNGKLANNQLQRLVACEFAVEERDERGVISSFVESMKRHFNFKDMHPFWDVEPYEGQNCIFRNYDYPFNLALPVSYEQAHQMNARCLSWDVYVFLADMLHRVPEDVASQDMPWTTVEKCFGNTYKDLKHFRENFKKALANVKKVYPAVETGVDATRSDVLILKRTPSPVAHPK
ncbi:MAG: hypothetical protein MJA28_12020 [Gammaproteobacteria bacterium]|nr:hypothetical protein [Gammaproteobacteria bacterium]